MFFDLEDYSPAPAPDREDAPSPLVLIISIISCLLASLILWGAIVAAVRVLL